MTGSQPGFRHGAKMSFGKDMAYGDYLGLNKILDAQKPKSTAHDELLFIIQHQTSELWMKLVIVELSAAREALVTEDFSSAFKMLARVSRIFEQLNNAWDVLRTMTPSEYTKFRRALGSSSGFQSYQYRMIEFILGNRDRSLLQIHEHTPEPFEMLTAELKRKSLYQQSVCLLFSRFGEPHLEQWDLETPHSSTSKIQRLWKSVYEDSTRYWSLYELAEKLVDLEDYFRRWRFNHVTTVERIIGTKRGTGGTQGVSYLRKMLDVELFPELWSVRGDL